MKRWVCLGLLILLLPVVSANQISLEKTDIRLSDDEIANVSVQRDYSSITSQRISYLVPSRYDPFSLEARDKYGELDCEVQELDIGKEILCTPRQRADYSVTFTYFGDFVENNEGTQRFAFVHRILSPTKQTQVRLTLPEGYGIAQSMETPYTPEDARVGSGEGRQFFIEWENNNASIGDTVFYEAHFEELQVLEKMSPGMMAGFGLVILLLGGLIYYLWNADLRRETQEETVASVFPVLKDDEKEVLRYIIDHEGEVEQRDIVDHISYSKAKISKLLSDLEERHLIEKEKQGRVNVVSLTREVGEIPAQPSE